MSHSKRSHWSSNLGFILATAGSAVGLGNIWKFPYIMGENGGAAFVLVYLLSILLIALPIMVSEVLLGRRGQANPVTTMEKLAKESASSPLWRLIGWMGLLTGFLILSFYSVVAGWIMAFEWRTLFQGLTELPVDDVSQQFGGLLSKPKEMLLWHSIFMIMTVWVVARGVKRGIELLAKILMPALMLMLLGLMIFGMFNADFSAAVDFMFAFDLSKVTFPVVVSAVGHAFFTLSLGMGAVMVYGSYLGREVSLFQVSLWVIILDTVIAIVAGLVIFPLVFQMGLEPGAGPGLIFATIPSAFAQMSGGVIWGGIFFALLLFAAWTSAISMLEPIVTWLIETVSLSRAQAAIAIGFLIWLLGIVTVFSFNDWAFSFTFLGAEKGSGWFDIFDLLTSSILLPLGGVLMAIFVGWCLPEKVSREELLSGMSASNSLYALWRFLLRYVSPVAVAIVLVYQLLSPLFA